MASSIITANPTESLTEKTDEDARVHELLNDDPTVLKKMVATAREKRQTLRTVGGDAEFIQVGESDALQHSEKNAVERLHLSVQAKHDVSNSEDDEEFDEEEGDEEDDEDFEEDERDEEDDGVSGGKRKAREDDDEEATEKKSKLDL